MNYTVQKKNKKNSTRVLRVRSPDYIFMVVGVIGNIGLVIAFWSLNQVGSYEIHPISNIVSNLVGAGTSLGYMYYCCYIRNEETKIYDYIILFLGFLLGKGLMILVIFIVVIVVKLLIELLIIIFKAAVVIGIVVAIFAGLSE